MKAAAGWAALFGVIITGLGAVVWLDLAGNGRTVRMSPVVPAAVIAVAMIYYLALYWWDGHRAEDRAEGRHRAKASRPGPRSRAGKTRAWPRVPLSGVRGRARPTDVPGRDAGTGGKRTADPVIPAGGPAWPRKAIARRIQGLRKWSWITQENIAARLPGPLASHADPFSQGMRRYLRHRTIGRRIQTLRTWWAFTRPRRQPSTEERQAMALFGEMHHEDTGGLQTAPLPAGCTDAFAAIARIGAELGKPKAEADDTGVLAAIRDGA